jgi:lipopolysaccharide/colanic/teichoic acid biosynthesis glycosyltransferase
MIRFFDLFLSFTGIIILCPLSFIITIINVFETRGNPFFIQPRVGRFGVLFNLIKFRTMHVNLESKFLITIGNRDHRITRFGYFLRRYKLDEIPQLLNVINGEMSLVGPRPEVPKYVNMYTPEQKNILNVRPGITDFASIEYFDENEILSSSLDPETIYIEELLPRKIELNLKFISNPSLRQYFLILWLTMKRILLKR